MSPLAQKLEAILRKQQPVSSEVFWAQVKAFQDDPEPTRTSSNSSEALKLGPKHEESLLAVRG